MKLKPRSHFISFSLLLLTAFLPSICIADVPPKIFITNLQNREPIRTTSIFYDPTDETILVSGIFIDISQEILELENAVISVNGTQAPASFSFTGNRTVDGKVYWSGTFSQRVPVVLDLVWPMRQFVAEIIDLKTYEALARHQVSLYDLRSQPAANPFEPVSTLLYGMYTQLTDRGLGHREQDDGEINLERTLKSLLPEPSLASFNNTLRNTARETQRYDNDGNLLRACVNLSKVKEKNFTDKKKFAPYKRAYNRANGQYRRYKVRKLACNFVGNPALVAACKAEVELEFCIKSPPKPKDFKLCVDQIEGDVQDLSIESVSGVGLNFIEDDRGHSGLLNSHISLSNMQGNINGYLRSLSVEWKNPICLTGPNERAQDSYIERTKWLKKWSTCKNMVVKESTISTLPENSPATYEIERSDEDRESPKVGLDTRGSFSFLNSTVNANKGICREKFIHDDAEGVAESFRNQLRNILSNTWYGNSPDTMEAIGLTKVLAPYRLGLHPHPNYDITATLEVMGSAPFTGYQLYWSNDVTSSDPETQGKQKQQFFLAPAEGQAYSPTATDHLDRRFDISYSIITGLLNKILNVRNASPVGLTRMYNPSWAELAEFGVALPQGEDPEDRATLNNTTLRQFDFGFLGIGNRTLQIELKAIFDPIVYMPNDVTAETMIPNVGSPTVYGIEGLEVTFKERDTEVNGETVPGKTWVRLLGRMVDRDFRFGISNRERAEYLIPHLTTDQWTFNIVETALPNCRMAFTGGGGNEFAELRLERNVSRLIKNAFRDNMIEMLSEVPAPQLFDGDGDARVAFRFSDANREQDRQNITFYGLMQND